MTCVIKIVGLSSSLYSTPFNGQYLKEYDPSRDGVDPSGRPMTAHVVTTPYKNQAMKFENSYDAWFLWKQVDPRSPIRADGKPNRPLTAFTVEVLNV